MSLKCVLPMLSDGEFSSNGAQKPCFNRRRLSITNTNISALKTVWGVSNSSSYFEMLHFYLLLSQAATTVYSELCLYKSLRWGISECETRDEREREREDQRASMKHLNFKRDWKGLCVSSFGSCSIARVCLRMKKHLFASASSTKLSCLRSCLVCSLKNIFLE